MKNDGYHQYINISDHSFPIIVDENIYTETSGKVFNSHWHEQIELLFYMDGEAIIHCGKKSFSVKKDDLLIINSNEIHYEESVTKNLRYFCIIIDISLLRSSYFSSSDAKYLSPISNNYIYFKNIISNDNEVIHHVKSIINEYKNRQLGFELSIKGHICLLLVTLFRNHVDKIVNPDEYKRKAKNAERLDCVLKYIEQNYNTEITIDQVARMVNISPYRFCHIFKEATGNTLGQYLNLIRVNAAEKLLVSSNNTVTEIALEVGYSNINYFSRVFKEHKGLTPSELRKIGIR